MLRTVVVLCHNSNDFWSNDCPQRLTDKCGKRLAVSSYGQGFLLRVNTSRNWCNYRKTQSHKAGPMNSFVLSLNITKNAERREVV